MVKQAAYAVAPSRTLPSYRKPPVTEVVAGVYFDNTLPNFGVGQMGLFWHRIQKEFPRSQHAGPVAPPGSDYRWLDGVTGLPLPRIWFVSEGKNDLIQLQGDCFFFNWRKTADGDVYPRYKYIIAGFEKQLDGFLSFLKESSFPEPKPMLCELTYVNHVQRGAAWKTIDDIAKIFKDFCWSKDKEIFPIPKSLTWSCAIDLPDNAGAMSATLSQVTRVGDQNQSIRLELACKGLGGTTSLREMRPWFDLAHEWIVRGFSDLTTPEAQRKLWEREDV